MPSCHRRGEPCTLSDETCLDAEVVTTAPVEEQVCANPVVGCAQRGVERAPVGFVVDEQTVLDALRER